MTDLLNRFREALGPEIASASIASEEFHKIIQRYSKSRRHYHNLGHLFNLFALCDELKIDEPDIILAIFYHDVIHNPILGGNEKRSAVFARRSLERVGIDEERTDRICEMILASRDHLSGNYNLAAELFLDLDMSILGAGYEEYDSYSKGIELEYSHVPGTVFRKNRRKFLKNILETEYIFRTEQFRKRFEAKARENMSRELESL